MKAISKTLGQVEILSANENIVFVKTLEGKEIQLMKAFANLTDENNNPIDYASISEKFEILNIATNKEKKDSNSTILNSKMIDQKESEGKKWNALTKEWN